MYKIKAVLYSWLRRQLIFLWLKREQQKDEKQKSLVWRKGTKVSQFFLPLLRGEKMNFHLYV